MRGSLITDLAGAVRRSLTWHASHASHCALWLPAALRPSHLRMLSLSAGSKAAAAAASLKASVRGSSSRASMISLRGALQPSSSSFSCLTSAVADDMSAVAQPGWAQSAESIDGRSSGSGLQARRGGSGSGGSGSDAAWRHSSRGRAWLCQHALCPPHWRHLGLQGRVWAQGAVSTGLVSARGEHSGCCTPQTA